MLKDFILGSSILNGNPIIQPNTIKTAKPERIVNEDVIENHFYNISGMPKVSFPTLYSEPNPIFITGSIPETEYFAGSKSIAQTNKAIKGSCK